jgi:transposase
MKTEAELFLNAIKPYLEGIVVCVECIFSWYWISDLCVKENIQFVLGHALYMKAIHGGKTKNDKIDSKKIAMLLRGGMLPMSYVYPKEMRSTRDLLRRRMHFMRKRAELLSHLQNTNTQYNLPTFNKKLKYKVNRQPFIDRFEDESVRKSVEVDLTLVSEYDKLISDLELFIVKNTKEFDANNFYLLRSVPGIGKILALVLLYEINDIKRFPKVQNFISYSRLVKPTRESNAKKYGSQNSKIGNVHLKWAFSEASVMFISKSEEGKKYSQKLDKKHGKAKGMTILSKKIGVAVYYMMKNQKAFDMKRFFNRN